MCVILLPGALPKDVHMYVHTYVHILKNLHVEKAEQAGTLFIPDTAA